MAIEVHEVANDTNPPLDQHAETALASASQTSSSDLVLADDKETSSPHTGAPSSVAEADAAQSHYEPPEAAAEPEKSRIGFFGLVGGVILIGLAVATVVWQGVLDIAQIQQWIQNILSF
jgi:uncharacterized membrane protein YcjF (UPF0283 family)